MRRINFPKNRSRRNKGETIVEVMVAFLVLMIILALFSNSISAASEASRYATEKRREADDGMKELQQMVYGTDEAGENTKVTTVSGVQAVRYETSAGLVYWVFENDMSE